MLQSLKAILLLPFLAYFGQAADPAVIRVAVVWETNEFAFADSKFKSSFMDGFYFFDQQLKKKVWSSQLGADQNYTMEMHTFDSEFNSTKIRVDFLDLIGTGKNSTGHAVGDFHFMIAATAKKNKDVMYVGETLKIPNIHASGGNPAMWWEHAEAAVAAGERKTYAFGMHLPFIGYTKPIIKAAAASGYKTLAILRPHGNFFQQTSAVAAVQWALDENFIIIGPSPEFCTKYAAKYTKTCALNGNGDCRCIGDEEPVALSKGGVVYKPNEIPTVYEIDEKTIENANGDLVNGDGSLTRNNVYPEYVDMYKAVWEDVSEQTMALTGEPFVDVVVHWPIQYKSSLKAMKDLGLKPKFFLGWNGGVSPDWADADLVDPTTMAVIGTEKALNWWDGVHAFGFGQWFKTLTYTDPFFGTDVAGILNMWDAEMGQGYGYDEFGACTTGVVLYLAVARNLFKEDFVGQTLADQRDNLRTAVLSVAEVTLWGFVQWNKFQQNTGGGISTTVAWQLQPSNDWTNKPESSVLVLPGAFAEGPYVKGFGTWDQRDGCSAPSGLPWIIEPAVEGGHPICRSCDDFGADIASPGLFVSSTDSTNCLLDVCPAGNYRSDADDCIPCTPGQFNPVADEPACDQCPQGEYSGGSGADQCDLCVGDSTTPRAGGSECVCKKGYFGAPGDGSDCQKCPEFKTTVNIDARAVSECVCQKGTYPAGDVNGEHSCISTHCFPSDPLAPVDTKMALDCPGNDGVKFSKTPSLRKGFYVATGDEMYGSDATIWKCLEESYCPGGEEVDSCADHRIGIGCQWCEKGYRLDDDTMTCVECDSTSTFIFIAVAVVVFVIMPLAIRPFVNTSVLKQSPSTVVALTALSIVAFNLMSISSLGSYSLKWIDPLKSLIKIADIFQFDLNVIRIQCVFNYTSPVAGYSIQVVGPTVLLGGICVLAVSVFIARKMPIDWPVIINLMGMLFSFFFVAIAVLSFYPWRCGIAHPFGEEALDRQPDVVCSFDAPYSDNYGPLVGLSVFAMLLYVVFYLSFVVWAVFKHQSMVIGQNQSFIRATRFLFFRWKNHCYYWTLFWHARSLFVALVPILAASSKESAGNNDGKYIQIVLLITLMGAWLAQISQTNPWRYPRLNMLDRVCTFFFVLMALSASYETEGVGWFVSLVVIAMGLAIVGFIGREVYLARTAASRPKADFYLCFHRSSAAIVARAAKFTIEYHSGSSVLLSSEAIELSDCMENSRSCKNIVVLWTDAAASDMTTAVEVTSAVANNQKVAILECDSLSQSLDDTRLNQVENEWTQEAIEQFTAVGLTPQDITKSFLALADAPLQAYNTVGGSKYREDAILALLETVKSKNLKVPHLSTLADSADLFIIHDHTNAQANASAFVLKNAMRSLNFAVATCSDYANDKFPAAILGRVQYAVVLLSNGVLTNANYTACLLSLDDACKITPVLIGADFNVPSNDRLHEMEKGEIEVDKNVVASTMQKESVDSKKIAERYRTLFKSLALPLSPTGSTEILNAEIGNVFQRVKSGKRGTTISSVLLK